MRPVKSGPALQRARQTLESGVDGAPDSFRPTVESVHFADGQAQPAPRASNASRLTRALAVMLACGALAGGTTPLGRAFASDLMAQLGALRARLPRLGRHTEAAPAAAPAERADAKLVRSGRSPVGAGFAGLLTIPPSFESADGAYDLVIHFHGNTDLVEDSFGVAGVNAVVVIINLGINSGVYEDKFASPDEIRELLSRVHRALDKRGLANAHMRRLALTSWSAGYGAILRTLENQAVNEQVDAVVLLDGIHARNRPEGDPRGGTIDLQRIDPFLRFARLAAEGKKLMLITHSDVKPPEYPGCKETTDGMLDALGVTRTTGGTAPVMPPLAVTKGEAGKPSTHGVPQSKIVELEPRSEAHKGGLTVRGYNGETPEHHMAHLIRMATLALPELKARWDAPR
jgi:hypothetical protein